MVMVEAPWRTSIVGHSRLSVPVEFWLGPAGAPNRVLLMRSVNPPPVDAEAAVGDAGPALGPEQAATASATAPAQMRLTIGRDIGELSRMDAAQMRKSNNAGRGAETTLGKHLQPDCGKRRAAASAPRVAADQSIEQVILPNAIDAQILPRQSFAREPCLL